MSSTTITTTTRMNSSMKVGSMSVDTPDGFVPDVEYQRVRQQLDDCIGREAQTREQLTTVRALAWELCDIAEGAETRRQLLIRVVSIREVLRAYSSD